MRFLGNISGSARANAGAACVEPLESRQFLSAAPLQIHLVNPNPQASVFPQLSQALQSKQPTGLRPTAVIHWGDGQVDTVGTNTNSDQLLLVNLNHGYARPGTYHVRVDLVQEGGKTVGTFHESEQIKVSSVGGSVIHAFAGKPFSGVVGTFHLQADETVSGSGVVTQIDWGDGTTTLDPTLKPLHGNRYRVESTHTYATPGYYAITVRTVRGPTNPLSRMASRVWTDLRTTAIVRG